jgi:hypothetical protein
MSTDNQIWSVDYRKRVLKNIPESRRRRVRECVRQGFSLETIKKMFNLTEQEANILYLEYKGMEPNSSEILGHKGEAYDIERFEYPKYTLESLSDSEKLIAQKDTTTKLWKWAE